MQTPIKIDQAILTRIWNELSQGNENEICAGTYEELGGIFVFIQSGHHEAVQKLVLSSQGSSEEKTDPWQEEWYTTFIRTQDGLSWSPWRVWRADDEGCK